MAAQISSLSSSDISKKPSLWLTRYLFQRALGCIYLIGFLVVVNQFLPLCGEHGLLPAAIFIQHVRFFDAPSIFWFCSSDTFFLSMGWIGVILSAITITGYSEAVGLYVSATIWFVLWLLYLSFVNIGQIFYAFGWETLLLETGFLAIFFGSRDVNVPVPIVWLLRWSLFRLMFGAGLIKIRGDECWRDLTCMLYHYETQPLPNPLSWYFHQLPISVLKGAVLFNHFTELVVPFGYFFTGLVGIFAGSITIIFQLILIVSGNFSWLNWITLVLCIACMNDRCLSWLPFRPVGALRDSNTHTYSVRAITVVVLLLSISPTANLLSRHQLMNTSYDPLHLVNSYGAFGSITKIRREIIVEGTDDVTGTSGWKEYEFKAKPGDVNRVPPVIAPYHLRLDWLMWFAPFSSCENNEWFIRFLGKLLENDQPVLSLIKTNPFPDAAPKLIRSTLYEYHFTTADQKRESGAIWKRQRIGSYCPIIEKQTEAPE